MTPKTLTLSSNIENAYANFSLLDYLCKRFPYKTNESWTDAILNGNVVVNNSVAEPNQILNLKDRVSYTSERAEPAVATNIETLFEDDDILVVNKPAPLPVHADGYFIINTLIHILRERTGNQNLHLGHRLDRETTGVLILSKNSAVTAKLMFEFEEGNVEKWYLAVTRGRVDFNEKIIRGWMGPKPESKIPMRQHLIDQPKERYKESSTRFVLRQQLMEYSLVECELLSGRTNQIRVHLESIGHSIVGDKLYGRDDEGYLTYVKHFKKTGVMDGAGNWEVPRQLLHAWKLSMSHPMSGHRMHFESPIPIDMKDFITRLSV